MHQLLREGGAVLEGPGGQGGGLLLAVPRPSKQEPDGLVHGGVWHVCGQALLPGHELGDAGPGWPPPIHGVEGTG